MVLVASWKLALRPFVKSPSIGRLLTCLPESRHGSSSAPYEGNSSVLSVPSQCSPCLLPVVAEPWSDVLSRNFKYRISSVFIRVIFLFVKRCRSDSGVSALLFFRARQQHMDREVQAFVADVHHLAGDQAAHVVPVLAAERALLAAAACRRITGRPQPLQRR